MYMMDYVFLNVERDYFFEHIRYHSKCLYFKILVEVIVSLEWIVLHLYQ